MPSQMSVPAAAGVVLPQDIIPQIVLNVTGKDYPSAAELLKGSTLPPLAEVQLTFLFCRNHNPKMLSIISFFLYQFVTFEQYVYFSPLIWVGVG